MKRTFYCEVAVAVVPDAGGGLRGGPVGLVGEGPSKH